jgi:hypothetical protein
MVNGKHKGGNFENKVLKDLRGVVEIAYKSLGSGNTSDEKGDIVTRRFMIECKHHRTFTDGEIDKYWIKLITEAEKEKKEPILIAKENRKDAVVYFWDYTRATYRISMRYTHWLAYVKEKGEMEL